MRLFVERPIFKTAEHRNRISRRRIDARFKNRFGRTGSLERI